MYCRSIVTPSSMLEAPAYGVCPPLRMANSHGFGLLALDNVFTANETSSVLLGCTIQFGVIVCCFTSKYESSRVS
jgi:hypothetical protein